MGLPELHRSLNAIVAPHISIAMNCSQDDNCSFDLGVDYGCRSEWYSFDSDRRVGEN